MAGNFRLIIILFVFVSCVNLKEEKIITAKEIINQNIEILIDNPSYFDIENNQNAVFLNRNIAKIDSENAKELFVDKFHLKDKLNPILFKLDYIPIDKVGNYSVILTDSIKVDDKINVQIANVFVNEDNTYACMEIITQHGIAAKFVLYFFSKTNKNKWLFIDKKVIAVG